MYGKRPLPVRAGLLTPKRTIKPVRFVCLAPEAVEVFIAGSFNQWNPRTHPLQRQVDGSWQAWIDLPHGGHHYHFLVDGTAVNDPRASGLARNERGEKVSMLIIS